MDLKEFASLGGKARWKGKSKKQRAEIMERVRGGRVDKDAIPTRNS